MKRRDTLACWIVACVLCLAVYWPGLRAWFQQDDFSWLGLSSRVERPGDLLPALFSPMAQGTIRPLSERGFFLLFHALFGVEATPYRAWVFMTQFANLALLGAIARRVTGSRLAGFLAPVFWVVNSGLVVSMSWTSAYNQVLCAFFMLLAFYCLLRRIETGKGWWAAAEWAAFVGGLASLEVMVVYPALAVLYTWLFARKHLRSTLPMLGGSAAYTLLHYFVAPYQSGDPGYLLHFGWPLAGTLWRYWRMALGPENVGLHFGRFPGWIGPAGTFVLSAAILGFAAASVRRRRWPGVFGLGWFVVALAPVLPLRDHVSSYYLTVPAAGLALAGACGVAAGWRSSPGWRRTAVALAAVYVAFGLVEGRLGSGAVAERSWRVRTVSLGAVRARQMFPKKMIVLAGVDSELFWTGIFYNPFRILGIADVYLEPGSEERIEPHPEWGQASDFVIPQGALKAALERGQAVVYAVEPRRLRGATTAYLIKAREEWQAEEPWRVDVGKPAFAGQLGPTWWRIEHGQRWMPRLATVRLRGPRTAEDKIYISGWCPPQQMEKGPLRLHVAVGGKPLPQAVVLRGAEGFQFGLRLPPELVNAPVVEVALEVERTFRAPRDGRDLGLVFGSFEIRR